MSYKSQIYQMTNKWPKDQCTNAIMNQWPKTYDLENTIDLESITMNQWAKTYDLESTICMDAWTTLNQMKSQTYRHVSQINDSYAQSKFNTWKDDQEPHPRELGFQSIPWSKVKTKWHTSTKHPWLGFHDTNQQTSALKPSIKLYNQSPKTWTHN